MHTRAYDRPLPRVRIAHRRPAGEERELGYTDEAGILELSTEALAEGVLVGRKECYAEVRAALPAAGVVVLELRLAQHAIAGRIRWPEGVRARSGCSVLAWPAEWSDEEVRSALTDWAPHVASTDVEPGGEFLLRGLDPARSYALVAVGAGVASAAARPPVHEVGATEVELTMAVWYGLAFRVREASGSPPVISAGVWDTPSTSVASSAVARFGPPPWSSRAGVEELEPGRERRTDQSILFHSSQDLEELGPIGADFRYPGYRPLELELWARPVAAGIRVQDIVVERTTAGFGDLRVRFDHPPCPLEELAVAIVPWPTLVLVGARERLSLKLPVTGPELVLDGLPHGEYKIEAFRLFGTNLPAPDSIRIGEAAASLVADLSSFACIEIQLEDGAQIEEGHLSIEWLRPLRDELTLRGSYTFYGPPHVIPALPPGRYTFATRDGRMTSGPVDILHGGSRMELLLRRVPDASEPAAEPAEADR